MKGIFRTLTYLELEAYSEPCYNEAQARKIKKSPPPKKTYLIFREMEHSSIKKFLILSYISGNGNPPKIIYTLANGNSKKLLISLEMELSSPKKDF